MWRRIERLAEAFVGANFIGGRWHRVVLVTLFVGGIGLALGLYMSPYFSWQTETPFNSLVAIISVVGGFLVFVFANYVLTSRQGQSSRKYLAGIGALWLGLSLGLLGPALLTKPAWVLENEATSSRADSKETSGDSAGNQASKKLIFVAHGGGALGELTRTNSLEALSENLDYFELFELDFNLTSDGEVVCIHDWNGSARKMGFEEGGRRSFEEFVDQRASAPYTSCTLTDLQNWLAENPTKKIVLDIKENDFSLVLSKISEKLPKDQVVVQIYFPGDYASARELGFESIIWTTYRLGEESKQILEEYLPSFELEAITCPKAEVDDLETIARGAGLPLYTHAVNDLFEMSRLVELGADGFYTSFIRTRAD